MYTIAEDDHRLRFIPISEIATPRSHHEVFVDYWWSVHPERGAVLWAPYRGMLAPQCNSDRAITERFVTMYPWAEVRQLPVAYVRVPNGPF